MFVGSTKEVLACFSCIFPRCWKKIMESQTQRMQVVTDVQSLKLEDPSPGSGSIAAGQIPENHRNRSFLTLNWMYIDVGRGRVSSTGYSNNSPLCTSIYVSFEIYTSIIWQIHISNQNRNQKMVYKDLWLNLSPRMCKTKKYVPCFYISIYIQYAWRHEEKASVRSHGCHPGRGMNLTNQRDTPGLDEDLFDKLYSFWRVHDPSIY